MVEEVLFEPVGCIYIKMAAQLLQTCVENFIYIYMLHELIKHLLTAILPLPHHLSLIYRSSHLHHLDATRPLLENTQP